MAKTTAHTIKITRETELQNQANQVTPAAARSAPPVDVDQPQVESQTVRADVDPNVRDVGDAHDPAQPGVPPWELNRVPSALNP